MSIRIWIKTYISQWTQISPKQQLGRWNIDYCQRMTRKLDLANYDNCGPCNYTPQTNINKVTSNQYK
jgi:hypothetical protein